MARLMVVDDEPVIRQELRRWLVRNGHEVEDAGSVEGAVSLGPRRFDLILCDLRLPGLDGTALLREAKGTPLLMMTSYGSIQSAVEVMRQGAVDYISKPLDTAQLHLAIERALGRAKNQPKAVAAARSSGGRGAKLLGSSAAMRNTLDRIRKVAPTSATVLILGESGTGKELVARAVHEQSPRRARPFVAVNCASIPSGLFESELFGHERGAFTGAVRAHDGLAQSADTGTLFLDEVGELPIAAQARLLRLLQEGEIRRVGSNRVRPIDTRLVAATHRNLEQMVAEGSFRDDLYFRLKVLEIRVPPLRERRDDIALLADAFLERAGHRLERRGLKFTRGAYIKMQSHRWNGNVRELENAIERAVILSEDCWLDADALGLDQVPPSVVDGPQAADSSLESYLLRFVLEHQNQLTETELAQRLGVSRKSLWERRRRLGIPRPKLS